ncbi:MAG: dethiobiotin synthase [Bacteroidetes bacterium]|nr:dethiobiotin synthase [Bacteroidota bacterium]
MSISIVGIHTGIGKTICSAIICEALGYDYWKPVQAGLQDTDTEFIRENVSNPRCIIHPEKYKLQMPASPHYAAALEGIEIKREDFFLPSTQNKIVVETAGGLMSPLAKGFLNIDLVEYLKLPVVLVSNNYLGSINHTLLTYEALKERNIPIKGMVFIGEPTPATEEFILEHTGLPLLFSIPVFKKINKESIHQFAANLKVKL